MTLVACTVKNGMPFLIGDILFTTKSPSEKPALNGLPSFPSGIDHLYLSRTPLQLNQKLYIISDNLAASFSGRGDYIRSFLGHLESYFKGKLPNVKEVADFVEIFEPRYKNKDLTIFILHFEYPSEEVRSSINGQITIRFTAIGKLDAEKNETFGDIYVAGSGTEHFIKAVADFPQRSESWTSYTNEKTPLQLIFLKSLRSNMTLIADFVALEASSAHSLSNHWGGGFELIYLHPAEVKFKKNNDYTLVIFKAGFTEDEFFIEPHLMLKHLYHDDTLLIRCTDFFSIDTVFPIRRIDQDKIDLPIELPPIRYDSHVICYSVIAILDEKRVSFFTSTTDSENETPWITIEYENETWLPILSDEERTRIKMEMRKFIKNDAG